MKSIIAPIILTASFCIIATQGFVVGPVTNNGGALRSLMSSAAAAALSKRSSTTSSSRESISSSSSCLQLAAGGGGDLRRPQEAQTALSGTVQRFTGMNGYGFIIPDTGGKNIFFLASAIVTTNDEDDDEDHMTQQSLQKGDLVTFDTAVEDDFKDQQGKLKAVNVMKVRTDYDSR